MSAAIRILLVDDHALLRGGVRMLLEQEPDMRVVGEAGTAEDALQIVRRDPPDVVIMDLSMPGMGGLAGIRQITAMDEKTRVLVLTAHAEDVYLFPVLEAGGSGYVTKNDADRKLVDAIRTVARGEVFLYPEAQRLLLDRYQRVKEGDAVDPVERLSERERQVLALTAEGYSAAEIGARIFVSPKTVETYRARVMEKLGLHHRAELVRFALRSGLLKND